MATTRTTARKQLKKKEPKIKKLVLTPAVVAQVVVPPGHVPAVVVDQARKVVEIAPVPVAKKRNWFYRMFE